MIRLSTKPYKEAKDNLCYEIPKMEKYNMNQEDIDFLNKPVEQGKLLHFHHQFFQPTMKGVL